LIWNLFLPINVPKDLSILVITQCLIKTILQIIIKIFKQTSSGMKS
jgi:hypothetical protein